MLIPKNFLIFATSLSLTGVLTAANIGGTGLESTARINLNAENLYVMSSLVILHDEVLNNQEEEYIVLGPDSSYFTGFNDGMTDAIGQMADFNFTGNMANDMTQIGANLASDQVDADALGTSYGTGMGTAYQYAQIVLNRRRGNIAASVLEPVTLSGSPTLRVVQYSAKPAVRLSGAGNQR